MSEATIDYNVVSYPVGTSGYINCPLYNFEDSDMPEGVDYSIMDEFVYSAPWIAFEILQGAVSKGVNKFSKDATFTVNIRFSGAWQEFRLSELISALTDKIREQKNKGNLSGVTFDISNEIVERAFT